jgi:hypothetical protein
MHWRKGTPHSIQSEKGQSKKEALWQPRFSIRRMFNQKLKELCGKTIVGHKFLPKEYYPITWKTKLKPKKMSVPRPYT